MAVFDSGVGIVAFYENISENTDYYIDNLYHPYGMYGIQTLAKRMDEMYSRWLQQKKIIWVTSYDAAFFLKEKQNVNYGGTSMNVQLRNKRILSLGSPFHVRYSLWDSFEAEVEKIEVPILINACGDLLNDYFIETILAEYMERVSKNFDFIFLADSNLHLKKSVIQKYFSPIPVISHIDMVLLEYYVTGEKKMRSHFYTTGYRRDFYLPAEEYLKAQQPLYVWRLKEGLPQRKLTFGKKRKDMGNFS